ncbi:MAG: IgGFc-binding protein, partial [Candidatus Kapaibacterium sp.]
LMGQNNSGTDYWFTIPPVYMDESAGYDNSLKILVASPVETNVTVEVKGKGFTDTKKTIANNVIEFTINPNIAQVRLHSATKDGPVPAKVYKQAGIHVTSKAPIVVYVIARYMYTSDGFLAIPSSALGTHYIKMIYQEPDFNAGRNKGLSAPFTGVTAAYDNTEIDFTMGGGPEGIDASPMENGQLVHTGQSTSQTLDQGDVWLLSINGPRQDLSGSIFKSDKPISIVSGINCANFPLGNFWCDYTVEMELPVYSWGKQYFITPMEGRLYNGIIRVFASEDNTNVYRDNELIGYIAKGGGATIGVGYIETRVWPKVDDNGNPIAPHIATIHSDKPIAVMYYNTGGQEDNGNASNTDPFMMTFSPVEQFGNQIYFASPNSASG